MMQVQTIEKKQDEEIQGLRFLWLELTMKCQLRCVHCYMSSSPKLPLYGCMEISDWERTLREGTDVGCKAVQFIGGEVTLCPELSHLVEYASSLGYSFIEVFSNGIYFKPQLKQTFVRCNVHLAFSFYSCNPAVHDKVTMLPGSQEKTLNNIMWAHNNNLSLRVQVVDTPMNTRDVNATCKFLQRLGIEQVSVRRTLSAGRGEGLIGSHEVCDRFCGYCWHGVLCVTQNGDAIPCPLARDEIVGHYSEGLKAIVGGKKLIQFREKIRKEFDHEAVPCIPCVCTSCIECGPPCICTSNPP